MKLTKLFSIFALMLALGFGLNSCEEDATSVEPVVIAKLAPPTELMATSNNETSVILKWTPSLDEADANFKGYEIMADGVEKSTSTTGIKNPITITGLSDGEHTFTVRALSADTTKKAHSVVATIKWAPAFRFVNDQKIRLYSAKNTGVGSGLILFDKDESFPYNLNVNDIDSWTVGIYDKGTDGAIKFGPAKSLAEYESHTTGKILKNVVISKAYFAADSLNEMFDSKALDTKEYLGSAEYYDLSKITTTKAGVIFIVKETTADGIMYAKVFLKKGTNGFFTTEGLTSFIAGEVSYQKTPNLPYAKTK